MRFCEVCGAAFRSFSTCPRDRVPTRVNVEDPLIGSILGDRYRILDRIAAGGMGQVYRAAHTRIACLFAVKVLYGDLAFDQQMMSRFLREAEVASCLQSRHIVRVVDFGQSQAGLPYLAMEYLDGPTLFDVITRGGPLAPARALRIAQRILRGLSHAHERGIVHRDMKTENVILTAEDDEEDIPKLLDFGVARLRESGDTRLTTAGVILGTPLYMAPEQLMGAEVDARTDLYAVGVILFEMLRGSPPFEAPSIRELAEKHITAPPPDLTQTIVEAGGDAATNDIVQKLLAKDPANRYASARDAAIAIEAILAKPSTKSSAGPAQELASPASPALVSLLENAILAGAPAYNAGDHLGCAGLYRRTAEEALKKFPSPVACAARLRAGILRSSARSAPMLAAWELRYAFDDLLLAAPIPLRGRSGDGAGDPTRPIAHELAAFASISARRETAGHMGILGDYAVEFARALAGLMRGDPTLAPHVQTLDEAVRAAEALDPGGPRVNAMQQGLDRVRAAIEGRATTVSSGRDAFRDAPPSFGPPPGIRSLPPPPSAEPSPAAERAGDDVSESLVRAMLIAKAAFDEGRFEVACRVYRESLEDVARIAARDPKGAAYSTWIRTALESASRRPEREAALVLRHAAEALLKRQ